MRRIYGGILATLLAFFVAMPPASAAERPGTPWVGNNPYVFEIGDSIVQQCHGDFGMDWRSLGFIGWPGATSQDLRERLTASTEGWPFTTEPSNAMERVWFRDAGSLVIGLGTNDVKTLTAQQFTDNVDWFMQQSRGRPVQWFTIHNPPFQAEADAFNAVLQAATDRWPNLKLMDWNAWANANPSALLPDHVHVATYQYGCQQGRNRLIQFAAPAFDTAHSGPTGYWYYDPGTSGPVHLNGWGAAYVPDPRSTVWINVRSDWGHVGRWPVTAPSADPWAIDSSGRAFGITLTPNFRGHLICLDLLDEQGHWTSLGCRVP